MRQYLGSDAGVVGFHGIFAPSHMLDEDPMHPRRMTKEYRIKERLPQRSYKAAEHLRPPRKSLLGELSML